MHRPRTRGGGPHRCARAGGAAQRPGCLRARPGPPSRARRVGAAGADQRLRAHLPSPLGRVLRLPAVPVPALEDPTFCVVHQSDAAHAMVAALVHRYDGPLNVVAPGATTPWQAARLGGRIPVPVFGPGWSLAARLTELAGAPLPEHTMELLPVSYTH